MGLESWRVPARLTVAALAVVNVLILVFVVMPTYPPNVPTISKALTTVHAHHANGDWSATVRVKAEDALFVIFDLEGGTPQAGESRPVQGQAVVTVETTAPNSTGQATGDARDPLDPRGTRDITLPFTWLPNGQRRTMYLTLLPHAPAGAVTGIRIRPGADAAVRQLRIAGSIPSHDF
jgi:hypothetical protein